ncbi:MAG: cupin domain-containing protein [Deferribacteres bacterium]|nr:cupin domain-containing protein [Deferribacteres bacterium]
MGFVKNEKEIPFSEVEEKGAKGVRIKVLIDGPHFVMRMFEVEPGGHTPFHSHRWEHEVYVLEGSGKVTIEKEIFPIEKGSVVLVESQEKHQFVNSGKTPLKFLCLIPKNNP